MAAALSTNKTQKQICSARRRLLVHYGVAALLLLHICCIDPSARDGKNERLFFFSPSHVTDGSSAKENGLETFLTTAKARSGGSPLPLPACMFNSSDLKKNTKKNKQPSGLFIGSKSLKMANSWHEAVLNIKCRGGRCDS